MTRLMTAYQVCERFGIPNPATLRTMRANGLPHVRLGKACLYDEKDVATFIESAKTCHARTPARASTGNQAGDRSTSFGTSTASNGFVQQAQRTAELLKRPSRISSAQVIALPGHADQRP